MEDHRPPPRRARCGRRRCGASWPKRCSIIGARRGSSAKHAALQLSRFPDAAIYSGSGDINDAENWNCSENQELLQIGPNGREASLDREEYR